MNGEKIMYLVIGCIFFIFLFWSYNVCVANQREYVACDNSPPRIEIYNLVALTNKSLDKKVEDASGSAIFLMMFGGGGFSSHSENYDKTILRYAYDDGLGIKLMSEEINNDSIIRIREIDSNEAKLKVTYKKHFNRQRLGGTAIDPVFMCNETETLKIFEIPKGSMIKKFNLDLEK